MGDNLDIRGQMIAWEEAIRRRAPARCRLAFQNLAASLVDVPDLDPSQTKQEFFVQEVNPVGPMHIWQFMLPPTQLTSTWIPFMDRFCPVRTFNSAGTKLIPTQLRAPSLNAHLQRIVMLAQGGVKLVVNGPWTPGNLLLTQYRWVNGTPLLNMSTSQLRGLLQSNQVRSHPAIQKWETDLGCQLPDSIWEERWLPFRAAKENAFLWQIVFCAFATLSWRFPTQPHTDPATWCPRCNQGIRKDHLHCIWLCSSARSCWRWCAALLGLVARPNTQIVIEPSHMILAIVLPEEWAIPCKLWQFLRAILCWLIWKERNACIFTAQAAAPEQVIQHAWHRLGAYIRVKWAHLLQKVCKEEMTFADACESMSFHFGTRGVLWDMEDFSI